MVGVLVPEPDLPVPATVLELEPDLSKGAALEPELDPEPDLTVNSSFRSPNASSALISFFFSTESLLLIQLESVRVTFLYFAFPPEDGTGLVTEFSGAIIFEVPD